MNKEFIPYKQALELKKLGFDEKCLTSYANDGDLMSVWNVDSSFEHATTMNDEPDSAYVRNSVDFKESNWCSAPLYQQAFSWLKEKYNIYCSIGIHNHSVITMDVGQPTQSTLVLDSPTYEQAQIDSLNKIIDIAKQKKI